MAIKGSIEERGEALEIFLIDPNVYFLPWIFFIELARPFNFSFDEFASVGDVDLDEFLLIMETQMMKNIIFFFV